MRKKNIALRSAIFKKGTTQRNVSREANIPESILSMAIHGKFNLNGEQQKKIAEVLGCSLNKIFKKNKDF